MAKKKINGKKDRYHMGINTEARQSCVCCIAGISHSNAIALGVLAKYMSFNGAYELVGNSVAVANINPNHMMV
jgi:predicted protein tyrosine phosphatase